ncbi:MAG: hypothetical protein HUK20_13580 [Fibrobacter sp.]|nr:hypothetical protein [Fibrobacter sp.]
MTLKERFKREDEPKPEKVSKYQGDIEALEHHFGDLKDRTIETSLIEIGKIVYRKRKRVDAYNGLAKTLKRSRNTTLTITSNKTKKLKP